MLVLYHCIFINIFLLTPFLNLIGKYEYLQSVDFYLWLFPAFVFMCYSQIIQLIIMTTSAFKYIQYATLVQGVILVFFALLLCIFWYNRCYNICDNCVFREVSLSV